MSEQTPTSTQTRDLVVTRVFDAPTEQAWRAWTDSEQVMRWWGPQGFTSPLAKMDVREGGTSLVCMRAPKEFGGQDMYNTWTYRTIVPLQKLEFILNFADSDGNTLDPAEMGVPAGVPRDVRHVVTFKAVGANQTEMTVTEYGYTSEQALELSKAGLEQCLDKMAASFAAA
ncbi:MAG: SRPBCC domain-containing protein [Chloroflexota bacterium]|nr:SRPBCC domain-containing protein [Chloroflexota bacterium]